MKQAPLRSVKNVELVRVEDLRRYADGWVLDGEYRQLSETTLIKRRGILDRLLWWLEKESQELCGPDEIKGFLRYVTTAHKDSEGRYGNPKLKKKLRTRTVKDIYCILLTFFRYLEFEGLIEGSPMSMVQTPIHRPDQIQPFSESQVEALFRATEKGKHAKRDKALLMFMLDTGVRASELCNLMMNQVDVVTRKAIVLGKGNKHRAIYFGRETGRALWQYIKEEGIGGNDPLFRSETKRAFTRSGLLQLFERLGDVAHIEATRCSPHTVRHTFAVMFLRGGGSVFSLKEMLGHTDLAMTNRYVCLAQADVQNQHRMFSPVERLRGRK